MSIPIHTTRRYSLPCGDIVVTAGTEKYRSQIPPTVESLNILGNVTDHYQLAEYRSNARSSIIDGHPIYTFGETRLRGRNGEPIGTISNTTAAVINTESPTRVVHMPDGSADTLVELTHQEENFQDKHDVSIRLDPSGGVVEGTPPGQGWTWYKKYIEGVDDNGTVTSYFGGTGISPVTLEHATGRLLSRRVAQGALIFDSDEPAFGTFCAVRDGNLFYLWGQLDEHIYLARVGIWAAIQKNLYMFWDGNGFSGDMNATVPVLAGYTQGSFFKTELFGHCYSWGFVGARNQHEGAAIVIGYSRSAAGPYQMTQVIDFEGHPTYVGSSCIYAHPWAFQEKYGQLMVTWYEEAAGVVVAAKLQFEMLHQDALWRDISLKELPLVMSGIVQNRRGMVDGVSRMANVHYEIEFAEDGTAMIKLLGRSAQEVDKAAKNIRALIANWYRELRKGELANELEEQGLEFERPPLGAVVRSQLANIWRMVVRPSGNVSDDDEEE